MKTEAFATLLLLTTVGCYGQGTTILYDQQSSTDETAPPYGAGGAMQQFTSPWGQSFTPALSSVDFVKLLFDDGNTGDAAGATIYLNLRSGSIAGTLLGATAPVTMPNGFRGAQTFLFPTSIPLSSGVSYFFEPILQTGGTWNILSGSYNYPGGSVINGGSAIPASDLWFREGIIVPEPPPAALLSLGAVALLCLRRRSPK